MENNKPSVERVVTAKSGWLMLVFNLGLIPLGIVMVIVGIIMIVVGDDGDAPGLILLGILLIIGGALTEVAAAISLFGHFTLQPNESRVLLLFGEYRGTVRRSGFYWANPFYTRTRGGSGIGNIQVAAAAAKTGQPPTVNLQSRFSTKISLRAQTLNGDQLKVNDKRGNPIEIAAMVIWRVEETAKAVFDVEDYVSYVAPQSESALRHLATAYPYEHADDDEPPLLRDAGIGGTVRVYFFIDENGRVQDRQIDESSGHQALDAAAMAVFDIYRFSPALNRDKAVPVWVSFSITFQVR